MPSLRCECRQLLNYRAEQAGQMVRCPACKKEFHLPASEDVLPLETPPPAPPADKPKFALRESNVLPGSESEPPSSKGRGKFELEPEGEYDVRTPEEPPPPRPAPDRLWDRGAARKKVARMMPRVDASISFDAAIKGAFKYPFSPEGIAILIAGAVFLVVAGVFTFVAGYFPLIGGLLCMGCNAALAGYILCFLLQVVERSADGRMDMPDWPEFTDYMENIVKPLIMVAAVGVIGFAPALLYEGWKDLARPYIYWPLRCVGLFYFLMGVLSMVVKGVPEGLHPLGVIHAIRRVPRPYAKLWGIAAAAMCVHWGLSTALSRVAVVGYVVPMALSLYLSIVIARALGLLHYLHRKELGVEDEPESGPG